MKVTLELDRDEIVLLIVSLAVCDASDGQFIEDCPDLLPLREKLRMARGMRRRTDLRGKLTAILNRPSTRKEAAL